MFLGDIRLETDNCWFSLNLKEDLTVGILLVLYINLFTCLACTHRRQYWRVIEELQENTEIVRLHEAQRRLALPQNILCDNKTRRKKNINWNKATQQQKLKYQQASKIWLSEIPAFEEFTSCNNPMCKHQQHIDTQQQFFYTNIAVM